MGIESRTAGLPDTGAAAVPLSSGKGSNKSRRACTSHKAASPSAPAPRSAPRQPPNQSEKAVMTGGAKAQPMLPVMPCTLNAGPRRCGLTLALRIP